MARKVILKEHQPWNLSYQRAADARPSWSKHGMPALTDEFIKLVNSSKNNGGVHLDVGCGNGVKTVNFALAGFNTVGIDISNDGFKEARELIRELGVRKKCQVFKANCLKQPFNKNSVRSASDILMFTHLKPKDHKKYQSELHRVLEDGGYLLMVLFSDKDEHFHGHQVSQNYTFKFNPDNPLMAGYAHYHGMFNVHFNKKDIKKTFADSFKIVRMSEVPHPIYPHRLLWNVILRKPYIHEGKVN